MPHDLIRHTKAGPRANLDHGTRGARNGRCQTRPRPKRLVEVTHPSNDGRWQPWDREVPWSHDRPEKAGSRDATDDERETEWDAGHGRLHSRRPENEYEALMACAPGDEPETHALELLAIREALADALDALPAREREVFDGVFTRRETLQVLGDRLGYSRMHVSRIRDRAVLMLQEALRDNPVVAAYLSRMSGADDD